MSTIETLLCSLLSYMILDIPDLSLLGGVGVIGGWDGIGSGMVVSGCVGTVVGVVIGGVVTQFRPSASKMVILAV